MTTRLFGPLYDRELAAVQAAEHCTLFLEENSIEQCRFDFSRDRGVNLYGEYSAYSRTVYVYVCQCRLPSSTNYSWSWPGYSADLTVLGVTAHEVGHHVHNERGWRDTLRRYHPVIMSREKPVSSYGAGKREEDLAEALKIFITNPTLLEELHPRRFAFLTETLGLEPVEHRHWREILCDSPRHLEAVENKL